MPFNFPKDNKNKAQWHFDGKTERKSYELDNTRIHNDVLGSYTGTPYDNEEPVQDADDL